MDCAIKVKDSLQKICPDPPISVQLYNKKDNWYFVIPPSFTYTHLYFRDISITLFDT